MLEAAEKMLLKANDGDWAKVDDDLVTEMLRLDVFSMCKLDQFMKHKDCPILKQDILSKMCKAYLYLDGTGLTKQERGAIRADYQGFYYLHIFRPYEENEWSRKIQGCKECFMPARVEGFNKAHICGYNLRSGPFYRYKLSNKLFCTGCLAQYPDK